MSKFGALPASPLLGSATASPMAEIGWIVLKKSVVVADQGCRRVALKKPSPAQAGSGFVGIGISLASLRRF